MPSSSIATGGASPPMARTGTRSAGTRAATLEPAGGYSKKSFLWIAAAVVLNGVVGAWFLFFRTPTIAEVDLSAGRRHGNVGYGRISTASDCRTCG